jgi:hypothetical protein
VRAREMESETRTRFVVPTLVAVGHSRLTQVPKCNNNLPLFFITTNKDLWTS